MALVADLLLNFRERHDHDAHAAAPCGQLAAELEHLFLGPLGGIRIAEEVDADKLAKEAEIQRAKAIESGKPEKIVDRIVAGQIEKYYKEVCLLDQQFVKDGDKTITSLMNETAKAAGTTLDIVRYVRFERGEGIEKRKDDLAAEIAAMKKA